MAIVVTAGSSSANSMCTLAEANTYIAASLYSKTAWASISDAEKESGLILAGLAMKNMNWIGWPCYENQAMPWPRWLPNDDADFDYTAAWASFPDNIKKAQAYLFYDVIWRALQGRTSPSAGPATDAIKSINLFGDVSISFGAEREALLLHDPIGLTGLLRTEHPEIYLLLSQYVTEISFIGDWSEETPDLLDEVA